MDTKLLNDNEFDLASDLLLSGEVVGFPTETVYGLGVIYDSNEAFEKMMTAKNRPEHKPFTLMCDSVNTIKKFAYVDEKIEKFLLKHMPGPITVLLKAKEGIPSWVTLDSPYVGVRIPDYEEIVKLIRMVGKPLLVPSANKSGEKPLIKYEDVMDTFDHQIAAVVMLDAKGGKPSTIVALDNDIKLIRQGDLDFEILKNEWRNL